MTDSDQPPETKQTAVDDPRPVNGNLWGQWLRGGSVRWEVVRRSRSVFHLNTTELIELLKTSATDPGLALQLITDDPGNPSPFWEKLDQRLHNQLASAASLIDHTRRLVKYYEDDAPALVAEYRRRTTGIAEMNEAAFLRDLRNYLLHYGEPPIVHTLTMGAGFGHVVKLSAPRLLEWDGWKAPARRYLQSFADRDGPVLGQDVAAYANAVRELSTWLFDQRQGVNNDPNVLNRFRRQQ